MGVNAEQLQAVAGIFVFLLLGNDDCKIVAGAVGTRTNHCLTSWVTILSQSNTKFRS